MNKELLILSAITVLCAISVTQACKGCISLDEYSFHKVVPLFPAALVKFDMAYPYGDKHEIYSQVAEELGNNSELLIGQVAIKDYGDRENEALGEKYGVKTKEDMPAVRLFIQGRDGPLSYPRSSEWTVDKIRKFVRENTDIYIGLPGCLAKYDSIAMSFITASDRQKKIEETEQLMNKGEGEEKAIGKTYIVFMKKIIDNGIEFIKTEKARLAKILADGQINERKRIQLSHRLNILHSFCIPASRDEL